MRIWDAIEEILYADQASSVFEILRVQAAKMGFENFGLAMRASVSNQAGCQADSEVSLQHNYRSDWAASYTNLRNPAVAQTDARILLAKLALPASAWNTRGAMSSPIMGKLIPGAAKQLGIAGEFGMRAGITVPLQSRDLEWGFCSFSTGDSYDLTAFEACIGDASLLANIAATRIMQTRASAVATPAPGHLSPREVEVLRWCAIGKTSWEISQILKLSERTVNFHLSRIAQRLGVRGRSAACAAAIARKLINI